METEATHFLNVLKGLRKHCVQDRFKDIPVLWGALEMEEKDQILLLQLLLIFEYRNNLLRQHLGMAVKSTVKNYEVDWFC